MSKKLKNISRNAEKGITLRWGDVWEAYIDLPKHGGSIAVCSTNKDEAVKIRQIILDALHAHGKEEDPEAWREENLKKQAAGVRFEKRWYDDWCRGKWDFTAKKEDYREVQEDPEAWREENLKKQAAGVRFEFLPSYSTRWERGDSWSFLGSKEQYREVQEDPEAWRERNRQRQAAGVKFDFRYGHGVNDWCRGTWDFDEGDKEDYREVPYEPKPAKLTAKIVRWAHGSKVQDWEFYGTPEGYRVECEKYGYAVVSEIKKVVEKPKTVKCYTAMFTTPDGKPTVVG